MSQFMPFPGYNPAPAPANIYTKIPCGGYVGRIENASIDTTVNGSKFLGLTLDVAEGPYAGWFRQDYERHSGGRYAAKYRGLFKLFYPHGYGDWRDQRNVDTFNDAIYTIECCNPGFKWDGTEAKLIGKAVGFIVREAVWNGFTFVQVGKLIHVNDIRSGKFELLPTRGEGSAGAAPATVLAPPPPPADPVIPAGFTLVDPGNDLPF